MSKWIVFCGMDYDHTAGGAREACDSVDSEHEAKELAIAYLKHHDWVQVMDSETLDYQEKDHKNDWSPSK